MREPDHITQTWVLDADQDVRLESSTATPDRILLCENEYEGEAIILPPSLLPYILKNQTRCATLLLTADRDDWLKDAIAMLTELAT